MIDSEASHPPLHSVGQTEERNCKPVEAEEGTTWRREGVKVEPTKEEHLEARETDGSVRGAEYDRLSFCRYGCPRQLRSTRMVVVWGREQFSTRLVDKLGQAPLPKVKPPALVRGGFSLVNNLQAVGQSLPTCPPR